MARHPASELAAEGAARLPAALLAANVPVLLMVLVQLTGDSSWLTDRYRPTRTRGLDDHPTGGLPEAVQQEVREAVAEALRKRAGGVPDALPEPSVELLQELQSVCMGEPVPLEYAQLMAAEHSDRRPPQLASSGLTALVVGAGVSGLAAAVRLGEAGVPYTVVERSDDLGGTWRHNRYPGAGVDTPSYLYSFSFFQRDWSTHFSRQPEVERYLQDLARERDLRRHIAFGTEAVSATWDDDAQEWAVVVRDAAGQRTLRARLLLSAVGLFNEPSEPALPGRERFRGEVVHTAAWPADLDLAGRSVAVVGSGASAMQVVPALVGAAGRLSVLQRTPQWIAPAAAYFEPIDPAVHWLMRHVPYYHRWYRFRLGWTFNDKIHPSLQVDPAWDHPDRSVNRINDGHRAFFTSYLRSELADRPDLMRLSVPDYPPFGKRILLDNGWFAALRHPTVALVPEAAAAMDETGVITDSGRRVPAEVVVLATGFRTRSYLHSIRVRGLDGVDLHEVWGDDDATAHLGLTVPGFPNLFLLYGPNSNPGGGSYIFTAECQVDYVLDVARAMAEHGLGAVECRREVHGAYNREVDEAHARMVWTHPGVRSYFSNGRGRVVTNSPWRVVDYWRRTRTADLADFRLTPLAAGGPGG